MKERMVLEKHEFYNLLYFLPTQMVKTVKKERKAVFMGKEIKPEKLPETWEDLKELCKGLKVNKRDCGGAMFEFPISKDSVLWLGKFLCVDIKGQVGIAEKSFGDDVSITIFSEHRTPAQMWNIIKSLTE